MLLPLSGSALIQPEGRLVSKVPMQKGPLCRTKAESIFWNSLISVKDIEKK